MRIILRKKIKLNIYLSYIYYNWKSKLVLNKWLFKEYTIGKNVFISKKGYS